MPAREVLQQVNVIRGFHAQLKQLAQAIEPAQSRGPSADGVLASLAEFLLQALHSHNRLNRTRKSRSATYGR